MSSPFATISKFIQKDPSTSDITKCVIREVKYKIFDVSIFRTSGKTIHRDIPACKDFFANRNCIFVKSMPNSCKKNPFRKIYKFISKYRKEVSIYLQFCKFETFSSQTQEKVVSLRMRKGKEINVYFGRSSQTSGAKAIRKIIEESKCDVFIFLQRNSVEVCAEKTHTTYERKVKFTTFIKQEPILHKDLISYMKSVCLYISSKNILFSLTADIAVIYMFPLPKDFDESQLFCSKVFLNDRNGKLSLSRQFTYRKSHIYYINQFCVDKIKFVYRGGKLYTEKDDKLLNFKFRFKEEPKEGDVIMLKETRFMKHQEHILV